MGMDLLYAAHVPEGDGPFPTLIALHGWGANAHDLLGLAPMIHDGNALVICPQGPVRVPLGGGAYGYGWFPLVPGQPTDPETFKASAERLRTFLDRAMERYPIDLERLALGGFSQGGVMGYALALQEPERFSGLAALSSWLPEPLAEHLPKAPGHEGFPILILHGTNDPTLPVERARESRELLRPYGVSITYREFEMGHEIRPDALRILLRWLDERAFAPVARPV
jgi:phospholipase/carboxylesterase